MGSYITNTPGAPPNCGKRLLPATIDLLARDEPSRVWCSLPRDDWDLSLGYEDITYAVFANAINRLARFATSTLGSPSPSSFPTIAYLGVPDIRYHMVQMALCKAGYKTLFSSQLNSSEVHLSLMEQTGCVGLLSAVGVRVDDLVAGREGMKHALIPDLDDLLEGEKVEVFPYEKTYEEAKDEPYLVLHSSGTTGFPVSVYTRRPKSHFHRQQDL